ncbi:MAG TPA: 2-amino-4-hydroxy-6-hydroxymethyldihydropteridine diphosphokinase [Ramlibacter sp.]|nr:2-amino-4-hydroxy-6-hydroxymethyldihydropteridine diphosphokinase [Ramlibacter sp.]
MREPVTAYVGLGANLGDPAAAVRSAIDRIGQLPRTRVIRASSLYPTKPHEASGPDFINAVAQLETRLDAMELLAQLQAIENDFGRERPYRNAPRTLDLDLLLYGSARIDSARLTVPHPRMWERQFVLLPLREIAPELVASKPVHES